VNGIHDLGGMDGFGRVHVEPNEPVFHEPWESRVFAMLAAVAFTRLTNADQYRHAVERMPPEHYLHASYYERMMTGLATVLVERGKLDRATLDARAGGRFGLAEPVHPQARRDAERIAAATAPAESVGPGADAAADLSPRFRVGDAVRVRDIQPHGHTRCPRYVRGRRGVVVRVDRPFSLPDLAAHDVRDRREATYAVGFTAADLWGASTRDAIHVDLWESYLERADG
jgi:nitrile hydratase subunit beta